MTFTFKKTGRSFDNARSAQNHCRYAYESILDGYLDAMNLDSAPLCSYCNVRPLKFNGFTKGFGQSCGDTECKRKNSSVVNTEIASRVLVGLDEFIAANFEEYCTLYHSDQTSFIDPYTKKVFNSRAMFRTFLSSKSETSLSLFEESLVCMISGEEYKCNKLTTHNFINSINRYVNMSNLAIRGSSSLYNVEFFKLVRETENFDNMSTIEKLKLFLKHNFTKSDICRVVVGKELRSFYDKLIDKTLYIFRDRLVPVHSRTDNGCRYYAYEYNTKNKILDDVEKQCDICNKKYHYSTPIIEVVEGTETIVYLKKGAEHTCSQKCYFKLVKESKNKYYPTSDEERAKSSLRMRTAILDGSFTPNVTNSRCKSRVYTTDSRTPLRSTWEGVFYGIMKEKGITLDYETHRIPYTYENVKRVYMPDFIDEKNRVIYEIKPDSEFDLKVEAKIASAKQYCIVNGYELVLITDQWFVDNLTEDKLHDIIKHIDIEYNLLFKRTKQFL